ncbi:MAG: hypothetical protein PHI97_24340 [Desulfobulbus sp.]|nr:hypothetical protein [Desulfobulbus sp.]
MLNLFSILLLIFTSFLNTCFADEPSSPAPAVSSNEPHYTVTPKEYVVPRAASTEAPLRVRESKSCGEYLITCERSCKDRGSLFKFQCIGQDFQPYADHSRCTCADDLFARGESAKQDQIQVKRESAK